MVPVSIRNGLDIIVVPTKVENGCRNVRTEPSYESKILKYCGFATCPEGCESIGVISIQ